MKKLKIIVLEDDPSLAALLKKVLLLRGHDVHVLSGSSFCPVVCGHKTECPKSTPCADVIISDHRMPTITGVEYFNLQKRVGCKIPDENKALITGSVMFTDLTKTVNELGCHFIKKPFKIEQIFKWVDECAERLT